MSDQHQAVEQLWYTWSQVGLGYRTGFRVRAASPGLKDVRSERVQSLDPYLYYTLPRERDRDTVLGTAPVCFSLVTTAQERVLLQKVYTGQDDYGRYGMYFIHFLVGLPQEFTAQDAISLWRSDFWQRSDKSLDPRQVDLEPVSSTDLLQKSKTRSLNPHGRDLIQKYLPFLVQAYLSKNLRAEKRYSSSPPKLYIAASDSNIALLIAKLVECLPPQLVRNLTFSTYESRLRESATEIVGRCWYSSPDAEQDPDVQKLLPFDYREELAINCYTGEVSHLANHVRVQHDPRIERCAQEATNYILSQDQTYQEMLHEVKHLSQLTVEQFLTFYEQHGRVSDNPTQEDIERTLSPRTDADYELSARMLSRRNYQRKLPGTGPFRAFLVAKLA